MRNRLKDGWSARDEIEKLLPKPTQERDNPFGPGSSLPKTKAELREERLDAIFEELKRLRQ